MNAFIEDCDNRIDLDGPQVSLTDMDHSIIDISRGKAVSLDLLFPAEHAYNQLLSLFNASSPGRITPQLLFDICRILEQSWSLSSHLVTPGPSHRTLLPILRTMRAWRIMEGKTFEGLASDLAALVDTELPNRTALSVFKVGAKRKVRLESEAIEDKENIPADGKKTHTHATVVVDSKREQHVPTLTEIFGEPLPSSSYRCIACAAQRAVSRSAGDLHNVQRALHHTHDNDGLAFPRPSFPASPLYSRSKSKRKSVVTPRSRNLVNLPSKAIETGTPRPLTVLASLNQQTSSFSPITFDVEVPISPLVFPVTDETDSLLSEIWIKRHSQEEGWRL